MEIKEIQKKNKDVVITVRTTKEKSEFMKDKNISPSLVFNKALDEVIGK